MKQLVGIITIALILIGGLYVIDKVTRSILGVKKESNFNVHINKLHANLHTLLILILFILYFVNSRYNFISNITGIIIFVFSIFTFHSLMQKLLLKESKEYIITFVTGVILTGILGITLIIVV